MTDTGTATGTGTPTGTLTLRHSPCPNDTFVFHAWSHGLVAGATHQPSDPRRVSTFVDGEQDRQTHDLPKPNARAWLALAPRLARDSREEPLRVARTP